ncbi:EKC/KEOPS complex subunit LAGE3-like [Pteronotus mesoamericanus]|uniref:EKC/KEOPS complex subunit LAGE3-like n=1 Tax=Pteronotus mesoamericanus TaxID=1884717 RepID=UPI0023EAD6A4|nr:EKC/KEOPS complex subunit LAGE3-like [Pteronotus parnellii mesoamericanus]
MQGPNRDDNEGSGSLVGGAGSPSGPGAPWALETGTARERKALQLREIPRSTGHHPTQGRLERPLPPTETWEASAVTVPFQSAVDAEVARSYLIPGAALYRGMVHWELTVTGSDLLIQLTAEDSDLLRISTVSLLIQLFIVAQIMQHLGPPDFANFQPKRAE